MNKLLIWGAGDHGTVTLNCAIAMNEYNQIDFLDFKDKEHREISGFTIYEEAKENLHHLFKIMMKSSLLQVITIYEKRKSYS